MKTLTITCENIDQIPALLSRGCDEVILAMEGECFTSMHGFSLEELIEITGKYPKKTAVLMNRLYGEEEIEEAEEKLERILPAVRYVFFADPALLAKAMKLGHQDQMIYRPETLLTSHEDGAWWMSQGIASIQISPLLTEEEICEIASHIPHTGLQIHGRLLMSVSKRKLLSAFAKVNQLSSLSDHRNLYLKEESREGRMPVYENAYGTMIYTDYVQESFQYMPAFMKAGIERFEIDTNGLSEDEINDAAVIYRHILEGQSDDGSSYYQAHSQLPLSTGYYGQKTVK